MLRLFLPGLKIESTSRSGVPGFVTVAEARAELPFFFFDGGGPNKLADSEP